ncbi:endopeptidase [Streptomyces sp. NPDC005096]|uniref:endopeptidase n=1 Tax=Streptomyces sp. NPDC005096 TaxID=3154559 RepID=UPI0033AE10D1
MEQQRIVGVHGIRQGGTSQRQLHKDWSRALDRGIRAFHVGTSAPASALTPILDVPHWSPLLARGVDRLGPSDGMSDESVPLTGDEEAFLVEAFDDLLRSEDVAWAEQQDLPTLGPPKMWPASLTRRVIAYDRRAPEGAGRKLVTFLREVRYYLTNPTLADRVRTRVLEAFSDTTTVVIAHSLGSVIAYDLIRHQQLAAPGTVGARLHTFVTCGSPLAIPAIRRAMTIPDRDLLATPPGIRWVNVHDPDDVITGAAGLALGARNVIDAEVDNGNTDPHAAEKYLRTIPVARAATNSWS